MSGAILIAGTSSGAGKSLVTAGICRWLARQGVAVAPFKAQNMSLHSAVTPGGAEIGRAQVLQAAAAGVEPEAAMNPVLLKPQAERSSQVVVLGQPDGHTDDSAWPKRQAALRAVVLEALAGLRARFDVVVCEGAGSLAEINLRAGDLANLGLARAADLPVLLVGDIDRGGVLAALYGSVALLEPADQALVSGFVINRFRGDQALLDPGLDQLATLTGRPTLGVLPWLPEVWLDAEDSLALERGWPSRPPLGPDGLDVAVVALPWLSNATDLDALACEPGVRVRLTGDPGALTAADLVVLPGTKATVAALEDLRARGLDTALARRAAAGHPVLGICGGYQLLGRRIEDPRRVESSRDVVEGLGLLPVTTTFAPEKTLARPSGHCPLLGGAAASGYEIHHGRTSVHGGQPLLHTTGGAAEGCAVGAVLGTSWHGLLEGDALRRALLTWVAARRGRAFTPGMVSFAAQRTRQLDALGDLIAEHLDTAALRTLIDQGAIPGLPTLRSQTVTPATPRPRSPGPWGPGRRSPAR